MGSEMCIRDRIKQENRLAFFKRMQQSAKEKAAPEAGNFPAQVSFNLNLEKPVPMVAFQEKIEDVAHLLDDEQSILASPTNLLFILETFLRILS